MKTLIVITEEEYNIIQECLNDIDADVGSIMNHPDEQTHVLKNVGFINISLSKLSKIFKGSEGDDLT